MSIARINPSPESNSIGRSGAALPTADNYGFYLNPAQLGFASRTNVISVQFYPGKVDWLPSLSNVDITFNSAAYMLGYYFEDHESFMPRSLGFAYMKSAFDYGGTRIGGDGGILPPSGGTSQTLSFDSETVDAFAVGLGWDFYVNLNIGLTYKLLSSKFQRGSAEPEEVKENAFDYGLLLLVPIFKFPGKRDNASFATSPKFFGYFDASFGYSQSNIAGTVSYIDENQGDPLPRTARLGYTLSAGIDMQYKFSPIDVLRLDWSSDAVDLLVNQDGSYQSGILGDIDVWNNFILGKNNDNVSVNKGLRLQLLEVLQFGFGKFQGPGFMPGPKTRGFGIKLKGILKFLAADSFSQTANILRNHIDVQYLRTTYNVEDGHPLTGTTYQSIGIFLTGF